MTQSILVPSLPTRRKFVQVALSIAATATLGAPARAQSANTLRIGYVSHRTGPFPARKIAATGLLNGPVAGNGHHSFCC